MTGGLAYPTVVRIAAPDSGPSVVRAIIPGPPTVVRVPAPTDPDTVRLETPGIPGPPGPQGSPGVNAGFGSITYSQLIADPLSTDPTVTGAPFAANQPFQLMLTPDPALSYDHSNPPFAGLPLWDGTKVVGRAFADRFEVQVNLIVRSQRANGTIGVQVVTGASAVPITADNADLIQPAGVSERVTLTVKFETLAGVMANGARLMLTSTVDGSIFRRTVIVAPVALFLPRSP